MKVCLLQTLGEVCIAMVVYQRIEATILLSFCDSEKKMKLQITLVMCVYIYSIYAIRIQDILNNYHESLMCH